MAGSHGGRWTQDRLNVIGMALNRPWLKPGQAALALDLHRASVHNYMGDGRLAWTRLKGSRLRSVRSVDVLRLVLEEMEQDGEGCPPELTEHVRCAVEDVRHSPFGEQPGERRTAQRTVRPNSPANGERRTADRTARRTANGTPNIEHQANIEQSIQRRTANSPANSPANTEHQANGEQSSEHQANGEQPAIEQRTANSPANGEQSG